MMVNQTLVRLKEMFITHPSREQSLGHVLEVFNQCNQALLHATQEQQLLDDICRIIVETGHYRFAWVGYAENDANKTVQPVAQWGNGKGYIKSLQLTWADTNRGCCPAGMAIRTGQPYTARNIRTDPNFEPWRAAALERGYQSCTVIPLLMDGHVFGVLVIYANQQGDFDPDEQQLLKTLAENLAYGVQAIRIRNEREKLNVS